MINKKIFFSGKEKFLPFFLRYFTFINKKIENKKIIQPKSEERFDKMEVYDAEITKCYYPSKPISKMISHNEQQNF